MKYFPKYTIELFIENGQWFAKFSDPAIVELFETDTIETGFTSDMQDKAVLTAISNLNPNSNVTLR